MIYLSIHAHRWEWTPQFIHGDRIARCVRCGDTAYDVPLQVIIGTPEWLGLQPNEPEHTNGSDHA